MQSSPFLILAIFGFPLNTPLPTRYVCSPLTTAQSALVEERGHSTRALPYLAQTRLGEIFSVPRSLCGAVQITALSSSFGHLCVSRNARVTGFALRGHQVIYAKSPTAHIRYSLVPSQYSPSTGQALAHRSRSRKGQSPKSAVIRGLQITCRRPRRLATLSAQTCTKSLA